MPTVVDCESRLTFCWISTAMTFVIAILGATFVMFKNQASKHKNKPKTRTRCLQTDEVPDKSERLRKDVSALQKQVRQQQVVIRNFEEEHHHLTVENAALKKTETSHKSHVGELKAKLREANKLVRELEQVAEATVCSKCSKELEDEESSQEKSFEGKPEEFEDAMSVLLTLAEQSVDRELQKVRDVDPQPKEQKEQSVKPKESYDTANMTKSDWSFIRSLAGVEEQISDEYTESDSGSNKSSPKKDVVETKSVVRGVQPFVKEVKDINQVVKREPPVPRQLRPVEMAVTQEESANKLSARAQPFTPEKHKLQAELQKRIASWKNYYYTNLHGTTAAENPTAVQSSQVKPTAKVNTKQRSHSELSQHQFNTSYVTSVRPSAPYSYNPSVEVKVVPPSPAPRTPPVALNATLCSEPNWTDQRLDYGTPETPTQWTSTEADGQRWSYCPYGKVSNDDYNQTTLETPDTSSSTYDPYAASLGELYRNEDVGCAFRFPMYHVYSAPEEPVEDQDHIVDSEPQLIDIAGWRVAHQARQPFHIVRLTPYLGDVAQQQASLVITEEALNPEHTLYSYVHLSKARAQQALADTYDVTYEGERELTVCGCPAVEVFTTQSFKDAEQCQSKNTELFMYSTSVLAYGRVITIQFVSSYPPGTCNVSYYQLAAMADTMQILPVKEPITSQRRTAAIRIQRKWRGQASKTSNVSCLPAAPSASPPAGGVIRCRLAAKHTNLLKETEK